MTIYEKPDYSTGVWASNGNITNPTSDKIEQGHVVEKPKYETVNFIENRQDQAVAYLMQKGVPSWDSVTEYPINAYIDYNGIVYRAKSQNVDKQPNINTGIWEVAFATNQNYVDLSEIVNSIRNDEGYLDLYVSKNNARQKNSVSNKYSFYDNEDKTLSINGDGVLSLDYGNINIAKFVENVDLSQPSKEVVTVEVLLRMLDELARIKVGDLYFTTSSDNPSSRLGYGTWERYAQGYAIVGANPVYDSSVPEWVKTAGSTFGEYSVALREENTPPHRHNIAKLGGSSSDINETNNVFATSNRTQSDYNGYIAGGQTNTNADIGMSSNPVKQDKSAINTVAHNNVQPSIVVCIWRRTA